MDSNGSIRTYEVNNYIIGQNQLKSLILYKISCISGVRFVNMLKYMFSGVVVFLCMTETSFPTTKGCRKVDFCRFVPFLYRKVRFGVSTPNK